VADSSQDSEGTRDHRPARRKPSLRQRSQKLWNALWSCKIIYSRQQFHEIRQHPQTYGLIERLPDLGYESPLNIERAHPHAD